MTAVEMALEIASNSTPFYANPCWEVVIQEVGITSKAIADSSSNFHVSSHNGHTFV